MNFPCLEILQGTGQFLSRCQPHAPQWVWGFAGMAPHHAGCADV